MTSEANKVHRWEASEGDACGLCHLNDKGKFVWASYERMYNRYVAYVADPRKPVGSSVKLYVGGEAKATYARLLATHVRQKAQPRKNEKRRA